MGTPIIKTNIPNGNMANTAIIPIKMSNAQNNRRRYLAIVTVINLEKVKSNMSLIKFIIFS
jgi:hypothetical protein